MSTTPEHRFEVGIIVARRRLTGPWASHAWLPVGALPAAAAASPWTKLYETEDEATFYAGSPFQPSKPPRLRYSSESVLGFSNRITPTLSDQRDCPPLGCIIPTGCHPDVYESWTFSAGGRRRILPTR